MGNVGCCIGMRELDKYQPDSSDELDVLFAYYINNTKLVFPVKRITAGNYIVGNKSFTITHDQNDG